jgi:UDP-glucose 4-epimerase
VTAAELLAAGHKVTVYDSLISGHAAAVPRGAELVVGDIREQESLGRVLADHLIEAVVYYGGFIAAGESMAQPGRYFANNVGGAISLLNTMLEYDVRRFVFSSSAAVYGEPESIPLTEDAPIRPVNPYGESKVIVEAMLRWFASQCDLRYVSLRYFNAAGAADEAGEDHRPETHLIPIVLQAALGQRRCVPLYGSDYPTPDGTCVRDYIHVSDLAAAHILALRHLEKGNGVYNLGNGRGFSNREVIETARRISDRPIEVVEEERRAGDPPVLVASAEKAKAELGWQPKVTTLDEIVASAWRWHKAHPKGYE